MSPRHHVGSIIPLSDVSQEGWAPYCQPDFFAAITIRAQALAFEPKQLQIFFSFSPGRPKEVGGICNRVFTVL